MERPISEMATMVNQIPTFVRGEAQGMEIGEVERRLLSQAPAPGQAKIWAATYPFRLAVVSGSPPQIAPEFSNAWRFTQ